MPSPLSSNASAPTPGGSGNGSSTRTGSADARRDFGQMLQGGASASTGASAAARTRPGTAPAQTTPNADSPSTGDGNADKGAPRPTENTAAAADASTPAAPATATPAADKDSAPADEAPWPPLGLAGLVLAVPVGVDPLPATPAPATGDGEATPAPAATVPNAALPSPAAAGPALPATAAAASPVDATGADALPLPEGVLGNRALDHGDDGDGLQIGDRAPPAPLQPPLPAALQDLKAALSSTPIFNGEPTPKPVFGDDGFDQAIGARIGWLADQKIGHAHIRLNPEDLGPVDVRLQMNGDKVHASFSSPHVDVRQALENSLPRLRELLGEQGFQLAHADVGHQAPGGDGNPTGQAGSHGGRGGDGEPSLGDGTVSAAQLIRQRGLLDAYA